MKKKSHRTKMIVTEEGRNLMGIEDCNKLGIAVWPGEISKLNDKNIDNTNYSFLINSDMLFFPDRTTPR